MAEDVNCDILSQMKEDLVNCKGYCLFRSGIDHVEQYRSIAYVYELLQWFNIFHEFDSTKIIAIAQGSKYDSRENMANHKLIHMAFPEKNHVYSHRKDKNYPIERILRSELADEYLTEIGTNHFLYLALK